MDFTNKPEFLFVMYGLLCIGAVPALINFNLTSTPLMHCITAANVKTFVFDSEIAANVAAVKDTLADQGIRSICLIDSDGIPPKTDVSWARTVMANSVETQSSSERPPDSLRSGPQLTDMEMLMYTSGTTGLPKPAIISFNKMGNAPHIFVPWVHLTRKDRFYTCMPLYHGTALLLGVSLMVCTQGTLIIGHKFHARTFWKEVRESNATVIQYVGEMCRYLFSAPPSDEDKNHSVRAALGNGMRPDVWNRFRNRFGIDTIAELYAATGQPLPIINC
jgi:acyl-CoA synthetase (AMP-forming)/AMP-acid ligase II